MIGKGLQLVMLIVLIGSLTIGVWELRDFGEPDPADPAEGEPERSRIELWDQETGDRIEVNRTQMDQYFLDNSQTDKTSTNNVVTAVVFDYRGIDTLGEATVLFTAVTGVLVAIRIAIPKKRKGGDKE